MEQDRTERELFDRMIARRYPDLQPEDTYMIVGAHDPDAILLLYIIDRDDHGVMLDAIGYTQDIACASAWTAFGYDAVWTPGQVTEALLAEFADYSLNIAITGFGGIHFSLSRKWAFCPTELDREPYSD